MLYAWGEERPSSIQCLSNEGKPIDWFIIYKLPKNVFKKQSFYYMDATKPTWTMPSSTMDKDDHAVCKTLQQIYQKRSDMMYVMYNDQPNQLANFSSGTTNLRYKPDYGHTKGVVAFDEQSGFWLIHSAPRFPTHKTEGYKWPTTLNKYGQTFLCISLQTENALDEIGKQLLYNYPDIYDYALPTMFKSRYRNMAAAIAKRHVKTSPWKRETVLKSIGGRKFYSFAKYSDFNADLYGAWLAPRFSDTLLVETWQDTRGKLCSNCSGQYRVYNIKTVNFKNDNVKFKETTDHSKWAITMHDTEAWTCVGDINRAHAQTRRPGGTVCFQNQQVWKQFHDLVFDYHDCKPYSKCVPS